MLALYHDYGRDALRAICVGVSCNLAYNFTTNAYSDMVSSGMQHSFCMWEIVQ